jgi:hypothetical protein
MSNRSRSILTRLLTSPTVTDRSTSRRIFLPLMAFIVIIVWSADTGANNVDPSWISKVKKMERIWVYDGSGIHNVGNLVMHVCNWGCFGSYPNYVYPTSDYPSAQWPANSGVEYLWIAGLWVGAMKDGVPVVSTSAYDMEFRPDPYDEKVKIYEAFEGMQGGTRLPGPVDDDRDGRADEDWLNGVDDDGDGLIDEDFAAIGTQMFTCWFTDDHPTSVQIFAEHTPLHLLVRQESYQWEEKQFFDFVGVEYLIKNYGRDVLEEIYIGFFADGDCGPRDVDGYAEDDCTGLFQGFRCARRGAVDIPVWVDVAYFYDADGDKGRTTGYFGILFLGHDKDPLGLWAPDAIGLTSYQNFSGEAEFEHGGDPKNDFQRYKLMSMTTKDRNAVVPRDYRMMMAVGAFKELLPDDEMKLQVAFVCGEGLDGMLDNAANAAMVYAGNWFNVDGDPETGDKGRETPLYGPVTGIDPDTCDTDMETKTAAKGEIIWVNADCADEMALFANSIHCGGRKTSVEDYQTGVGGRERQVNWLVGTPPPAPNLRVVPGDRHVVLLWDNFSEVTPDVSTLEYDFEGYRVWRADGWERPLGTSVLSGPSRELWQLLDERDLVNGIAADRGFKKPFAEGGWSYDPLGHLPERDALVGMFEESVYYFPMDEVPCPPGLTDLECDTLEALARYNLGFEGGLQYYKYVDRNVHNGMHYFYSVTAFDHILLNGKPLRPGKYGDPSSNFHYVVPLSDAQREGEFDEEEVYVVPNPATTETMSPWRLEPNFDDPTGIKVEFRNLPACFSTVRIYTIAGDLVQVLYHDGRSGHGTLMWDLVSRNGQDVTSGVYLFAVEPDDDNFTETIGKFVVIR